MLGGTRNWNGSTATIPTSLVKIILTGLSADRSGWSDQMATLERRADSNG